MGRALPFIAVMLWAGTYRAAGQENPLPVPPLAEAILDSGVVRFELRAAPAVRRFLPGSDTPTLGYNGDYLGPTIRVRRGDDVEIRVTNGLDDATSVHWHGLFVQAQSDGGPHQAFEAGDTWTARFRVAQQAATLWYHPHPIGRTGEQVYKGLAGLLIVDDDQSDSLGLPSDYGVNDIPLIVQDRNFDSSGRFVYVRGMPDVMHGIVGNTLLVNGAIDPVTTLPRGLVRLRILNGSDSNIFEFQLLAGARPVGMNQIASDGGLLDSPLPTNVLVLATGERGELVVDLEDFETGDELTLVARGYQGPEHRALRIRVGERPAGGSRATLPVHLAASPDRTVPRRTTQRDFVMSTMGPSGQLTINGERMDMDTINFQIRRGTTEVWRISNPAFGMMSFPHAFHIHNGQFLVLDVDGGRPPPELSGWKDTFLVWPNQVFRVIVRFEEYVGIYMYHCHFLVHEDAGMMGQFEIVAR